MMELLWVSLATVCLIPLILCRKGGGKHTPPVLPAKALVPSGSESSTKDSNVSHTETRLNSEFKSEAPKKEKSEYEVRTKFEDVMNIESGKENQERTEKAIKSPPKEPTEKEEKPKAEGEKKEKAQSHRGKVEKEGRKTSELAMKKSDEVVPKASEVVQKKASEKKKTSAMKKSELVAKKSEAGKAAGIDKAKLMVQSNELHWQYPKGQMTLKLFNKSGKRFCARISSSEPELYIITPSTTFVDSGKDVVIVLVRNGGAFKEDEKIVVESAEAAKGDKDAAKFWLNKDIRMDTVVVKMKKKM